MTSLANKIMDELMDCPGTISDMSAKLGVSYEGIRSIIRRLKSEGIVHASGTRMRRGKPEIIWDMTRTRKTA